MSPITAGSNRRYRCPANREPPRDLNPRNAVDELAFYACSRLPCELVSPTRLTNRLGDFNPSITSRNPLRLGYRNAELSGKLGACFSKPRETTKLNNLHCRHLRIRTSLSIHGRPVDSFVRIILGVSTPSKIGCSIVMWNSVQMSNLRAFRWISVKCTAYNAMDRKRLSRPRGAKSDQPIPAMVRPRCKKTPCPTLTGPDGAITSDSVIRESVDLSKFNRCIHMRTLLHRHSCLSFLPDGTPRPVCDVIRAAQ